MTIVEQHSMSNDFVPIQNIKNLKLFASLDDFRYGHRRSLGNLAPAQVCIQQTSNLLKEDPFTMKAWEQMTRNVLECRRVYVGTMTRGRERIVYKV